LRSYHYQVCGLSLGSALPLSGLKSGTPPAQIQLHLGPAPAPPKQALVEGCYFQAAPEEVFLYWHDVGTILVRRGREIILDLFPEAVAAEVHLALTGPVLAVLLHQRGKLPLHASGVAINGGAVVFLGDPGRGKSTLAALFYAQGHPLLADDLIALEFAAGGTPLALPAFPRIRLSPEVVNLLGAELDFLPPAPAVNEEKVYYRAHRNFPEQPLPLSCVYVLDEGATLASEPLRPREALVELLRHTYRLALMHDLKGPAVLGKCAELANRVPIRRLRVPRTLAALSFLARMVESEIFALSGGRHESGFAEISSPRREMAG